MYDGAQAKIEGNYDDVDEDAINPHQDFALYSFIAMDIAGAIALAGNFFYDRKLKVLPEHLPYLLIFSAGYQWKEPGMRLHCISGRKDPSS